MIPNVELLPDDLQSEPLVADALFIWRQNASALTNRISIVLLQRIFLF